MHLPLPVRPSICLEHFLIDAFMCSFSNGNFCSPMYPLQCIFCVIYVRVLRIKCIFFPITASLHVPYSYMGPLRNAYKFSRPPLEDGKSFRGSPPPLVLCFLFVGTRGELIKCTTLLGGPPPGTSILFRAPPLASSQYFAAPSILTGPPPPHTF